MKRSTSSRSRAWSALTIALISAAGMAALPSYAAAAPARVSAAAGLLPGRGARDELASVAADALESLQNYAAGSRDDLSDYEAARTAIAAQVGQRLSIDPKRLARAWQRTDIPHQLALMAALSQLGTPYARNTSAPGVSFDCSGLTTYAWAAAGVDLPRQSAAQIRGIAPRTQETAMAGDLVHYPGHIMMYLGVDRAIVHAIQPGRPVEVDVFAARRKVTYGSPG